MGAAEQSKVQPQGNSRAYVAQSSKTQTGSWYCSYL